MASFQESGVEMDFVEEDIEHNDGSVAPGFRIKCLRVDGAEIAIDEEDRCWDGVYPPSVIAELLAEVARAA